MTTEELIQQEGPLALELEYAELEPPAPVVEQEGGAGAPARETEAERQTKKERILALYNAPDAGFGAYIDTTRRRTAARSTRSGLRTRRGTPCPR